MSASTRNHKEATSGSQIGNEDCSDCCISSIKIAIIGTSISITVSHEEAWPFIALSIFDPAPILCWSKDRKKPIRNGLFVRSTFTIYSGIKQRKSCQFSHFPCWNQAMTPGLGMLVCQCTTLSHAGIFRQTCKYCPGFAYRQTSPSPFGPGWIPQTLVILWLFFCCF